MRPVNLVAVVREALKLLRPMLPDSIEVVEEIAPDANVWIEADANQMHQVLLNLAINARDAMPKGGVLRIELTEICKSTRNAAGNGGTGAGEAVLVISDDGHGMSRDVGARIFEPFFTTKETGKGSGLGLSVVHGIIASHQGTVDVQSDPGKGTTFTVRIPTCAPPSGEDETDSPETEKAPVVLVAEDNLPIGTLVTQAFRAAGYRPNSCTRW